MINVKVIAKQKSDGTSTGSSSGITTSNMDYGSNIAKEAAHAEQADEAIHAENADLAIQAQNLTSDSTDWQTIANNLQKAIDALKGLYLSKTTDDTAAGKIKFLKGLESVVEALFDKGAKFGTDYSIDELGNAILNAITAASAKLKSLTSDSATITDASISNVLTAVLFKGLATFSAGVKFDGPHSIDSNGNAVLKNVSADSIKATDASISNIFTDVLFKAGAKFAQGLNVGDRYSIDALGNAIMDSLKSSDFDEATQTGFSQTKDGLLLKNLTVWGKAIFNSLEIRKVYNVGGVFLASPAGGTIKKFEDKGTFYRCYLLADDGTTRTTNLFEKGDQVLCQDFNIKSGVYSNVSNKRYWRKIIDISTDDTLFDDGTGHKFAWVDLSKTDCEAMTNDAPSAGDVICTLGNDTDKDRQNAILLDTTSPGAPILALYKGVNTYSLENKDIVVLSPAKVKAVVNELYTVSETGEVTDTARAISDNSDRITDVSKSLSDANGAMSTARAALQKEIDSNSADIKTNAGAITSQGTQIQQTNGSLTTLAGRVTTTEKGITSNSTAIRQNSDSIGALSSRVTKTESGVSDNHSAILSNSDLIKTKVEQSDYDTNNKKIDTHFSAVEQTAKGISSSVTDVSNRVNANKTSTDKAISDTNDKVDNIQVGARNYALGTSNDWYSITNLAGIQNECPLISGRVIQKGLQAGDIIFISLDYRFQNFVLGSNANIWIQGNGNITGWNGVCFPGTLIRDASGGVPSGTGVIHIAYKHTITDNDLKDDYWVVTVRHDYVTGTVSFRNFMVAKSTNEVDWSPAPEDVDASISDVDKRVDDVNTLLNTTKSDLQKDIDDNKTDADGKISAQGTKIDQTKSDVTTLAGRVTTTEKGISDNTAAIDVNAKAIKTKVEQSDYDTNNKKVSDEFSEVKQTTDGITANVSSVSKTADSASSAAATAQKTADGKASPTDVANAKGAAIDAAAKDATNKANDAQSNAETNAAKDATTKVNEASGVNKWVLSKYVDGSLNYGGTPSLEEISKLTPVNTIEDVDPGTSGINGNIGFSFNADNYVGKATTYIFFRVATNVVHNLYSDDGGAAYVNGNLIGTLTSCQSKSFSLPFAAGWNRVDLLWSEVGGGDGFSLLGLVLHTYTNVSKMTAYPKGELQSLISKTYTDSQIKVVNDSITTKVSQTDYDSNNKAIQSQFTEYKQTTDSISLTVNDVSSAASKAQTTANTAVANAATAQKTADGKASPTDVANAKGAAIDAAAKDATNKANDAQSGAVKEVSSGLTATGINIVSHVITATANNFKVQNNSGVTTFSVDSAGNIVGAGGAQFNGKVVATTFNTANNTFVVDSAGNITCNGGTFNNVKVTGEVQATDGKIGEFAIMNGGMFGNANGTHIWIGSRAGGFGTSTCANIEDDDSGAGAVVVINRPNGNYAQEGVKNNAALLIGSGGLYIAPGCQIDTPGFMFGGRVNPDGSIGYRYGPPRGFWQEASFTVQHISTGAYRIIHNLGHTNYFAIAQELKKPDNDYNLLQTTDYNKNDFTVCVRGTNGGWYDSSFTFAVFGQNI
nr:hypothetical protein [uncultured Prevotella sp.]